MELRDHRIETNPFGYGWCLHTIELSPLQVVIKTTQIGDLSPQSLVGLEHILWIIRAQPNILAEQLNRVLLRLISPRTAGRQVAVENHVPVEPVPTIILIRPPFK